VVITLFVSYKGYIPSGGSPLPSTFLSFPVDVVEGIYRPHSKLLYSGDSISEEKDGSYGTLGEGGDSGSIVIAEKTELIVGLYHGHDLNKIMSLSPQGK
jgi:hypothetical protein